MAPWHHFGPATLLALQLPRALTWRFERVKGEKREKHWIKRERERTRREREREERKRENREEMRIE